MSTATLRHLSHRDDPASSGEAAERMEGSGDRARHLEIVFALVRDHPGSTACELLRWTTLGEYPVRRRLSDLLKLGRVERGEARKCSAKGSMMCVWRVAGAKGEPATEPAREVRAYQGSLFR